MANLTQMLEFAMPHPLEHEYGLSAGDLLDAVGSRFRARVTLEGAVAEVHLGVHVRDAHYAGLIERYEEHDQDGVPDFSIWLPSRATPLRVECKNVRDHQEAFRHGGRVTAYKVETQKTRTSNADQSSRFYGFDQFEILAVCLGKKTHDWRQFMFVLSENLKPHDKFPSKMAVMHPVPLPEAGEISPWYRSLADLIGSLGP